MELERIRSVFPDFQMEHFHMFDTITSLKWENIFVCESGEEHKTLLLTLTSPDAYKIVLEFTDVHSLYFRGNRQISGFYIKDMSGTGYENASKYEVGDYEENEIAFYCSDVTVKEFFQYKI